MMLVQDVCDKFYIWQRKFISFRAELIERLKPNINRTLTSWTYKIHYAKTKRRRQLQMMTSKQSWRFRLMISIIWFRRKRKYINSNTITTTVTGTADNYSAWSNRQWMQRKWGNYCDRNKSALKQLQKVMEDLTTNWLKNIQPIFNWPVSDDAADLTHIYMMLPFLVAKEGNIWAGGQINDRCTKKTRIDRKIWSLLRILIFVDLYMSATTHTMNKWTQSPLLFAGATVPYGVSAPEVFLSPF